GIVPGFTDRITTVRPVAAAIIDVTETMFSFFNRTRQFDFGAEHSFDRLEIDYNATYSQTHNNLGSGKGGTLTNRLTGAGWILDRTQSDLYPRFLPNGGPDFTNAANYRPNGQFNTRNNDRDVEIKELRGNFRYNLPTSFALSVKTGFNWREQMAREVSRTRRWNYLGTTALPADPSLKMWAARKTGANIPQWESASFFNAEVPVTPALWREDIYYSASTNYTGTRSVTETVTAGYVMGQGKIGRLGLLSGVRFEKTEDESWGWVRNRTGSTAAQQTADPIGSATADYANTRRTLAGEYTKAFPSMHATYDLTPNLKARASWSTSFGRPAMTSYLPNETVNETNGTLTINNPNLKPQTAKNWDFTLDYYFEPVGNLSVGWFHKEIKDYLVTGVDIGTVGSGPNNGYNGDYVGLTQLTTLNAGTAYVQGWEFSYQQQFTFLPGLLKGLSFAANYTLLETHGDFGGTIPRATGEVPQFIPRTGNVSLSWRYRSFSARVLANYTGNYINAYTAGGPARNQYRFKRTIVNLGASYQFTPKVGVSLDVSNLFNEPVAFYRGIPDRMERTLITGTTLNLGITGRF
ncbi:MAG: TonB-dependent receptor, partial [Rhodoglobus sp.]|nr:TonB-dependent receptor [Rhodoglobus sp.]